MIPQLFFGWGHVFTEFFGSSNKSRIVGKVEVGIVEVVHNSLLSTLRRKVASSFQFTVGLVRDVNSPLFKGAATAGDLWGVEDAARSPLDPPLKRAGLIY